MQSTHVLTPKMEGSLKPLSWNSRRSSMRKATETGTLTSPR